jgi:transcriptional regulator with XRE-family HTH domain
MRPDRDGFFPPSRNPLAANLERVMARQNLSIGEVVRRTGLDDRTIRAMLRSDASRPRPRTVYQLAAGLGVDVDELFQSPSVLARRTFDRRTNPIIDDVTRDYPHLFDGWTLDDFDDLYSRFGTGGQLTAHGALTAVERINARRATYAKVAVLLETGHADLLVKMVDALYGDVLVLPANASLADDGPSRAGTTTAEDAVAHGEDVPDFAVGFDDVRADDRFDDEARLREVPTDVARQVRAAR